MLTAISPNQSVSVTLTQAGADYLYGYKRKALLYRAGDVYADTFTNIMSIFGLIIHTGELFSKIQIDL